MSTKNSTVKPRKAGTSKRSAGDRKRVFVEAYLSNGGNLTESALAAGYSPGGAAKAGYRMSKDALVMSMIGQRTAEVLDKYKLGVEDVYRSIAQELHFDPGKLYNANGTFKRITELDEDTRMALTGVDIVQVGSPDAPAFISKPKWNSKASAREQLIKIKGMYKADNEQHREDHTEELRDEIESARAIAFTLARAAKLVEQREKQSNEFKAARQL